jgi:hypothetical protein
MVWRKIGKTALLYGVLVAAIAVAPGAVFAQEQERGHWTPPAIVAPADGSSVGSPVTVTVGMPGHDMPRGDAERHRHGPQFILVVDAPAPAPGSAFQADAQHVTFPEGQMQMSLALPPGQHQLRLTALDREGAISRRFPDSGVVTITVK